MAPDSEIELKPHLSYEEQLKRLIGRGMAVDNEPAALESLRRLGYYRLSGFWYPFRRTNPRGVPGRQDAFQVGTSFETIVSLYEFDRQLRLSVMDAVERIEVAMRVDIGHRLGKKHPLAHKTPNLLDGKFTRDIDRLTGETAYSEWSKKMNETVRKKAKEEFVKHHKNKYGGEMPIWVITELWEFGLLSKFFAGMQYSDQLYIAKRYGLPEGRLLATWLRSINFVRNVSAHHGRLWNRSITDSPSFPKVQAQHPLHHVARDQRVQTRVYSVLCVLQTMLKIVSPGDEWKNKLISACSTFPQSPIISLGDAGFPDNWGQKTLWQQA